MKRQIKTKEIKDAKDYTAIVLEDMRSDFRAFGEMLGAVKEKGDATFEEVGKIKEDTSDIKREIISIKHEIQDLKHILTKKADLERVYSLESRVARIEKHLRLISAAR